MVRPAQIRMAAGAIGIFATAVVATVGAGPASGASVADVQAALQAQTLALTNLPAGWTATDTSGGGGGATAGCSGKPFGASGRVAMVEASFEDPAGLPQLFEQISLYHSTSSVFQRSVRAIDRCRSVSVDSGGDKLKIHVAELAYRGGKKTSAYALSFAVKGEKVGIDIVLEQIGDEVVQVSVADSPKPTLSEVEPLVAKAVKKVEASPKPGLT
jgi:hypothetical protein